jgi:hypothetical protein
MVSTDAIDHVFVGIEAGVLEDKLRWDLLRAQRNTEESGAKCDERTELGPGSGHEFDPGLFLSIYPSLLTGSRLLPIQLIDKARALNLVDEAQIPIVFLR